MALTHEMSYSSRGAQLVGIAIGVVGGIWDGIAMSVLNRSRCPRCGREFFSRPPAFERRGTDAERHRGPASSRATSVWSQRCANCDLSLGLGALPRPLA